MEGVVDDRPLTEGPPGVGTKFEMDIKEGRQVVTYQGEITKYDRHRLMGITMVGGCGKEPMTMHVDYLLTDLGAGRTQLDYTCTAEPPKKLLYRLMMPLFKLFGRMFIKKFMNNLRRLVEPQASATA